MIFDANHFIDSPASKILNHIDIKTTKGLFYTNEWIVKNRPEGKVELFRNGSLEKMNFPVTNVILLAEKSLI